MFTSSRLYNAVNVDSISIVFVEMLAILDLIIAVSFSLPVAITLAANRFILGKLFLRVSVKTCEYAKICENMQKYVEIIICGNKLTTT